VLDNGIGLIALYHADLEKTGILPVTQCFKTIFPPITERLGAAFRFFHLDNWPGYKAGAINYALQQTAKDAEIIAVIDSDYMVDPLWLKSLVPYFAKQDVGFVQAPQDYRDWRENGFKALCHWALHVSGLLIFGHSGLHWQV
jgi:cellulose synthase/poly-beta-1,6-N-acetylglucosamine synthase-like glycosyltransferase